MVSDDHQLPSGLNDDLSRTMRFESSRSDDLIDNMAAVHISAKSRFIPLPFDDGLSSESDDDSGSGSDMSIDERDVAPEVEKGITTFAFVLNRGVIVAVNHHSCESVENVIDLSSHVLVAFSGEVENCGSFLRDLQSKYQDHERGKGKISSVEEVSQWVAASLCSSSSERGSSMKITIAGWDGVLNRPRLYCVDGDGKPSLEGLVAAGSGSIFATYRYDTGGFREYMLDEDAVKFAKGSIRFAASMVKRHYVNGQTGRFISGYYVGADGWKVVFDKEDVGETVTEYEYSSIEEDVEDA